MKKKLGPLKVWQWAAIGGGGLLLYYLYKRHQEGKEVNPEEEEKLLGALGRGAGAGGGGTGEGTLHPAEGPAGIAGPEGQAGVTGPPGEAPAAGLERQVASLESRFGAIEASQHALNTPPTKAHTNAPQAGPRPGFLTNPGAPGGTRADKEYKVVNRGGTIYHVYPWSPNPAHRAGIRVGPVAKPPTKRPKPAPLPRKIAPKLQHPPPRPKAKAKQKVPAKHR